MNTRIWLAATAVASSFACADLEPRIAARDSGVPDSETPGSVDAPAPIDAAPLVDAAPPRPDAQTCAELPPVPGFDFYEAGCSDTLACSEATIVGPWAGPSGASGTGAWVAVTPVEGTSSYQLTCSAADYCGFTFECPKNDPTSSTNVVDLSGWPTMHISLKGNAPDVELKLSTPCDNDDGADQADEASVTASAYGYAGDDAWHDLAIPVADFDQGMSASHPLDLARIYKPLILGLTGLSSSQTYVLQVDALYFAP